MQPSKQAHLPISVTPLDKEDREEWETLWALSIAEYGSLDPRAIEETWKAALANSDGRKSGIGALAARNDEDGSIAGFLHYVIHPVAGATRPVCYMQDLFVNPKLRRQGIASTLIAALNDLAFTNKWERIYWLVDDANENAKGLYNNIGFKLNFSLHALPIKAVEDLQNT